MIEFKNYDFDNFDAYRRRFIDNQYCDHPIADVETILEPWRKAKNLYLAKMFNDNLILEREISYHIDDAEKIDLMKDLCYKFSSFIHKFQSNLNYLFENVDPEWNTEWDDNYHRYYNIIDHCFYEGWLDANEVDIARSISIPDPANPHKHIRIQCGEKVLRVLSKTAKLIGMEEEFEEFRIKLSQITNVQTMTGTMCLSIHPLDYATASDNANGWSSCMSWEDEGCYRLGTIEMMNSPMVICAYVKSNHATFDVGDDYQWNSKKWRAWIICDPQGIVCNKNYPFHSPDLSRIAVEWVKELVSSTYHTEFDSVVPDINEYCNRLNLYAPNFHTHYMYDDTGTGCTMAGCLCKDHNIYKRPINITYSGVANCMACGEVIPWDPQNKDRANTLTCFKVYVCSCCHNIIESPDDIYYDNDGNMICAYCYDDLFTTCDICGELVPTDEISIIKMDFDRDVINTFCERYPEQSNWFRQYQYRNFEARVCSNCFSRYERYLYYDSATDYYYIDPIKCTKSIVEILEDIFNDNTVFYYEHSIDTNASKKFTEFLKSLWDAYTITFMEMKEGNDNR